ncbi:MAG: cupin domain-containing protein [Planctomycetaceae bacterium]|nr:cupin domain-containing protein [Planctomycetaceae bacterium]
MKVIHADQLEAAPVQADGAVDCRMCCLIGPDDAAPSFSMRRFEVAPGGSTPKHTHAYEHEVYVLEGNGVVTDGTQEHPLRPGIAVYVQPNELHQFRNTGSGPLRFLCLIPHPLRGMREVCVAACGCSG